MATVGADMKIEDIKKQNYRDILVVLFKHLTKTLFWRKSPNIIMGFHQILLGISLSFAVTIESLLVVLSHLDNAKMTAKYSTNFHYLDQSDTEYIRYSRTEGNKIV